MAETFWVLTGSGGTQYAASLAVGTCLFPSVTGGGVTEYTPYFSLYNGNVHVWGGTAKSAVSLAQLSPAATTVSPGATFYYGGTLKCTEGASMTTFYSRSASAGTGGSVRKSGNTSQYGTSAMNISATPDVGYAFVKWQYSDGSVYSTSASATIASSTSLTRDTDLTAVFRSTVHTLTVYAGTGGTVSSSPASGSIVTEGSQVTITATPAYNYTFSSWSGLTGAGAIHTFFMPSSNFSTTANFTVRPSFAIALTKENGAYGTIALTSSTAPSVGETAGAINATGYTNVSYTVTATVPDSVHNMFLGWYSGATLVSQDLSYTFTQTTATALNLVAKFAQRTSYTLTQRVSDGSVPWVITNSAIVAGCAMAQDRAADFSGPDRWLSGNITITATPATGWRVSGWSVSNSDGGAGSFQDTTGVNPLTFNLSFNAVVMCVFELIPVTATVAVDAPAALVSAGTAELSYGLDTGDTFDILYGENAIFTATAAAGYGFGGWFDADGLPYPDVAGHLTSPLIIPMTGDLTLTAKFTAPVTLTAAHTVAADNTGTVAIDSGTAGATATANVIIGETCVIKAISTAIIETPASGSQFNSWYATVDPQVYTAPLTYLAEQTITVADAVALTAYFVGFTDLEDRYLLIRNYNNNTSEYDSLLGILAATGGTEIDKEGAGGWDAFYYDPPPGGLTIDPQAAGDRYYKFTGSVASTITAVSNASLGFMQWKSSYLIPHTADVGNGYTNFAESSPVVIGTVPKINIVTNRHYVLTAVWGDPVAVDVTVKFADGCDESNGAFSMSPTTENRVAVQGGVSDKYLQGAEIVFSADVENGYVFNGWYYDAAATNLASADTTFTHSVLAPTEFYAKFTQDTDAIYKWEGGTANKMMTWRSKRYVASKPFNPSSARVYADAYHVTLSIYMSSSPDAPSPVTPTASVYARNQNGFRLPMARPEKYVEIEVQSQSDVTEAVVSTSMEGLAQ